MNNANLSRSYQIIEFENKRKALLPTLGFCFIFFTFYYIFLILPRFGIDTEVFWIDNLGGAFIISGFILSIVLSKYIKNDFVLMLPSFSTIATACLFLAHRNFYENVNHLWLSAQIIGIIFALFLGSPKTNIILFLLNISIIPLLASQVSYLNTYEIIVQQAIIYFSSIVSIYLSINSKNKIYQLLESRDRAQLAEKAKAEFLANMSHEIRTPMNGVLGNAELLHDSNSLTKECQEYVRNITESGAIMMKVLNDILDFSKIDAGQLDIDIHSFDLKNLLESIGNLYNLNASSKGLMFSIDLDPNVPRWVCSDSIRLRQVLSNLLNNSIKFTEHGKVHLKVSKGEVDGETFQLNFQISDTGIGMTQSQADQIFQSFTQADISTTRKYGGTGLGLSICENLVKLMGGEIHVKSHLGKGSEFSFYIKTRKGHPISNTNVAGDNREEIDFSHLKVLLVEDNAINQNLAIAFLKKLKVTPDIAENGQIAVDKVTSENYDLVFMDCQMPIMDGYTATKTIRKLSSIRQPTIVAMTANALNGEKERCIQAGMNHYLTKPLSVKSLQECLTQYSLEAAKASLG